MPVNWVNSLQIQTAESCQLAPSFSNYLALTVASSSLKVSVESGVGRSLGLVGDGRSQTGGTRSVSCDVGFSAILVVSRCVPPSILVITSHSISNIPTSPIGSR